MGSNATENGEAIDPRWARAEAAFNNGDIQGALFLFKAMAKDGEPYALVEVGNLLELDDPQSHFALARLLFNGSIAAEDKTIFFRHAQSAMREEKGFASLLLGRAHELGMFSDKNLELAKKYYGIAAAHGFVVAMRQLGVIAFAEGRWDAGLCLFSKAALTTLKIASSSLDDPRLAMVNVHGETPLSEGRKRLGSIK